MKKVFLTGLSIFLLTSSAHASFEVKDKVVVYTIVVPKQVVLNADVPKEHSADINTRAAFLEKKAILRIKDEIKARLIQSKYDSSVESVEKELKSLFGG